MTGKRSVWRMLAIILWGITWPFSELLWRPLEAHEDVSYRRAIPLLGVAVIIGAVAVVSYIVVNHHRLKPVAYPSTKVD